MGSLHPDLPEWVLAQSELVGRGRLVQRVDFRSRVSALPVQDYFDDLSVHLVYEIYKRDFELFGYEPFDPAKRAPVRDIDLAEVHAKLSD